VPVNPNVPATLPVSSDLDMPASLFVSQPDSLPNGVPISLPRLIQRSRRSLRTCQPTHIKPNMSSSFDVPVDLPVSDILTALDVLACLP
jgi:hypothetical protein